jgi:tetratricopeptide (TPR) repeat protein
MLGLWKVALSRVELPQAHRLAQECMRMAQHHQQDSSFLLTAHLTSGITLFCLGEIAAARDHLEQARCFYNPAEHGANAFIYGEDPGVVCLTYFALALWVLGFPDRALKRGEEALALARKLEHPFTLALR